MTQLDTSPGTTQESAAPAVDAALGRVWWPIWIVLVVGVAGIVLLIAMVSRRAAGPAWSVAAELVVLGLTVLVPILLYLFVRTRRRLDAERKHAAATRARLDAQVTALRTELREHVEASLERSRHLELMRSRLAEQLEQAMRAAQRSERLQRFTARMLDRVSVAGAVNLIAQESRRAVDAALSAVAILRDGEAPDITFVRSPVAGSARVDGDAVLAPPEPGGRSLLLDAADRGEPIWIPDEATLREHYPWLEPDRTAMHRAWAALPLQLEGRKIGALGFAFDDVAALQDTNRAHMLVIAQQCAQALERARLHDMELRARVRTEFAERRLALLAEAGARLSASLDHLAALTNLGQIAVPEVADWCIVHLIDHDEVPRLAAVSHIDPQQAAIRRSLEERYPASLDDRDAYADVLRTGKVVHVETVTDQYLRHVARDAAHFEALRSCGIRTLLSVPLSIDDRTYGAVTFGNAESGRRFTESDVTLAHELASRATIAVENARLYQAASRASDAKSDFLAVMSHELRTPLNAIMGYSDLLLMGVPDDVPDRARRQIERIRDASRSLLQLVDEILSFSRIEAGREDIRISPVNISNVLRECMGMIEPLAAGKGLSVMLDTPAEPIKIISDEPKIRQVMMNLLSNAVKFTERGDIRVVAWLRGIDVVIEVRDTGIGIAQDNIERIFDPFWQVEQSATRRFGGAGLGLGVARKLAKLLGGSIEVQSTVGEGSTFSLILPVHTPGLSRHA